MNRMTRSAVAAALAATVALGVSAPAAAAAPKDGQSTVVHTKGKTHKAKPGKADRSLTPVQRRLTRKADRKDVYLGRVARSHKVQRLDRTLRDAVVGNIAADQGELADLRAAIAAGEGMKELRGELRGYRVQVYRRVANQLRLADGLLDDVAGMSEADRIAALIEDLKGYDANETTRADLRSAQRVLSSVKRALEEAETEEPTEPVETTEPQLPTGEA